MQTRKNIFEVTNKKRVITLFIAVALVLQCFFIAPMPKTEAATITLYPSNYTYVKPAPYWPCSPCDEFGTTQQVKIIERDYDYFYIEYTKNGILKRGYASITHFDESDYAGYSWCNHTHFTTGYNNTTSSKTAYYTSTGSATFGSIDADEGEHADKPLMVLRYENSRAFVQYVTNPGTTGHALYKRAWVDSSCITLSTPAQFEHAGKYTLIKNQSTGKYLQVSYTSSGYSLTMGDPTGYESQQWQILEYYDSRGGYYYKLKNVMCGLVFVVENLIPVVNNEIQLMENNEPNKGEHFAFEPNSDGSYKISTRCSGYYLVVQQTGTTVTQEKPTTTATNQNWIFEPIHKYWNQFYTELSYDSNGKAILPYYIDTSSSTGIGIAGLTVTNVQNAVSSWNSAGANVVLQRVHEDYLAKIIITTKSLPGDTIGRMEPYNNANNAISWIGAKVYLDTTSKYTNLTVDEKTMVLRHELGHALKLMHPYGEGYDAENHVVYSVMNQGLPSGYPKVVYYPSQYDLRTIKNKWGG